MNGGRLVTAADAASVYFAMHGDTLSDEDAAEVLHVLRSRGLVEIAGFTDAGAPLYDLTPAGRERTSMLLGSGGL